MYKLVPITTALVLALAAAQPALAQGHGNGKGGDKHEGGGHQDRGNGGGNGHQDRGDQGRGNGHENRGQGNGQDRRADRAVVADRYDWLWRTRDDAYNYRYDSGYLYRVDRQGSLLGWLPVLGGALSPGSAWPSQFAYQPAPEYYSSYFGLPSNQQYRYADGALYGVDPQTQMISQVAALLTGQNLSVGQALPSGYDVYNVPYAYRDQYADNANAMYRYNDGYVYQADPKTQLITAVIQLLT